MKGKRFNIIQGNCLDVIDTLQNDYDICFTSPPYNLYKNDFECEKWGDKKHQKYGEQKDCIEDYVGFLENVILKSLKKCKYFFLNIQSLANNKKEIIELNYRLKNYYCDTIIWNKGNGIPNGCNSRVMTNCFEYIHIYSLNPSRAVGTKEWKGNVKNVIDIKGNLNNSYSKIHKALFPLELPLWILKNFVRDGGKVLDVFGGLGTTSIAANILKMESTLIEINKDYCDVMEKRIIEENNKLYQEGIFSLGDLDENNN